MPDLYASPQVQASVRDAQQPLWSDYLKTVGIGTTDLLSAVPAGARYAAELTDTDWGESIASSSQYLQDVVHGWGEDLEAGLSDPAKERLLAEFGSEDFWKHPASSIALKAARTTPSMAATVGATMLTGGGAPAAAMFAGMSGGLSATQTVDDMYRTVDTQSDAELRTNPLYNQFRKDGLSERDARKEFNHVMIGAKPAILFAVGAATSLFGPEAQVARALGQKGLGEAFSGGILTRAGKAFGTSAASEAIETGAESIASEQGAVDVGFQPSINPWRVASSTAEGAVIGGLFGLPGGVRSQHTNANPRPNPINPPAAAVTNAVKPNQASVPVRASNTNASPEIVPPTGKFTGPTSRNATVPGAKGDVYKKSKQAPGPPRRPAAAAGTPAAVTSATTPAPVSGTLAGVAPAPQVAPQASQGDPGGLVAGPTEVAALNVQVAPTVTPEAPTVAPTPRTPSQVQQATGVPYAQAREVAAQEGDTSGLTPAGNVAPTPAAAAPAPTPTPEVPARTPSPGEGFGAGPGAAPVVQGRPSAFGGVEVAAPAPVAPRVLQAAATPEVQAQIDAAAAADEAAAKDAEKAAKKAAKENPNAARAAQHGVLPLQGKQASRNQKFYDDADAAQALLDKRPTNPTIPATEEEVDALATEIGDIVKTAAGQVSEFRGRVGFPTTPHSLVWLREAQEFVSKLSGKKIKFADKLAAATRFLDRETRIRKGEGEAVKVERNLEGEAAMAARGLGKGKVTEQTVEGATVAEKNVVKGKKEAVTPAREVSPEVRAEIEARTAAESIKAVKEKAAEAAKPKPLPVKVSQKVEASKEKTAEKKAAQEAKLPAKVREKKPLTVKATPEAVAKAKAVAEAKKVPPKPSSPAASSAEFAAQVKEEVEPNPSDAQLAADNASKAHVNIEGMPLAIETAANTDRHIVKSDGGRISRLYKHAYGHILGTKAPDGNPIDIFLGPEAYPNNPKLEGLQVVVIDQVDPDTKVPDEPKVMFGFAEISNPKKGTGALEAYKDSYPRGEERIGDVTPMTLNQFKQWVKSKHEIKNAKEPAGEPISELDALIAEQTEELSAEDLEADREAGSPSGVNRNTSSIPIERRVKASRARAEATEKVAAAFATRTGKVSDLLDEGMDTIRGSFLDKITRAIFPRFAKRIRELAGDVQVYVVPDDIFHNEFEKQPDASGFYSLSGDYIVIKESTTADDVEFAGLVLHEATHAAFMKAVYSNPKYIAQLEKILAEAVAGDIWDTRQYGLSNIDELMAEAFSDQRFQSYLLRTLASDELIKELGLDGKRRSLWDTLVRWMGKVMGFGEVHDTLFSAVMKMSAKLELEVPNLQGPGSDLAVANFIRQTDIENAAGAFSIRKRLNENLPAKVSRLLGTDTALQEQAGTPWVMFLRTMDQLIQSAKNYGMPFYEHLRKAADIIERTRTTAEKYFNETVPLIRESHFLEKKYKGNGVWQRFVELAMEATRVQVYPDRPLASQIHLGKKTLRGAQPKAEWAALNVEYEALKAAAPDLMDFYSRSQQFYKDQQNKIVLGLIRNSLKVAGFGDPDLAQRLFDETETEADKDLLGEIYDHIKDASELAKVEVYFPQMRRGNWVVRAAYKITAPTNALRQVNENTWEFAGKGARKRAMDYAASQAGTGMVATPVSVWVDTNTGERYFNLGQPDEARVRPEDTDAEQRFRVTVENRYVSFHESKREARKVSEELKGISDVDPESIAPVVERKFNPGDHQADLMSHQMQTLANSLQRRSGFQNLSDFEKNQVVQAFNVASLRLLGSTRIQSKRLPRTNVLGASNNFTRNMTEYAQSTSGYLAKLDHNDDLNQAMREARKEADSFTNYNKSTAQSQIMNEMEKRVARSTAFEASGKFHEWGNRLLALGFASRLISPAYNIINALQVAMVTYPALASRFGPGRAAMMLLRTYREVGVGKALKGGLVASKRTLMQGPDVVTPSIVDDMIARIKSPQVRAMLQHLIEVGSIDANSGIEIPTMIETRTGVMGGIDQGINYVSTFGRQMPKSIEAINRIVTAVASYNLEMQRSGNHDLAVRFAQETTNTTQGHYAHSNAAPIFNHPLGRLSFQFKKFPQLIYNMIGQNIGKAIANAEPGDRAEAVKTLAYMAATHFVMAGALGLPQEPLKWLIIGARQAGITELSWADVENYEREMLASAFGQQLGEIVARGITRALPEGFAFDLSSRVGLQDLITYGEPRSADQQDLNAFLWNTIGGAPAGQIGDWIRGAQALSNGDWAEASQRFSPVKMLTDAIKAGRGTLGGQKTAAGYEKLSPFGAGETVLKTLGFMPAREAETAEARSYFGGATKRANATRNAIMQDWFAAPAADRGRMWGQVEKFNYGKTRDEKLTRSDLDKYAKRRRTEERTGLVKSGFRVTRREAETYKKLGNTYNISP